MSKFKFQYVDAAGSPVSGEGLLGLVGFSKSYQGDLTDEDSFVVAIRKFLAGEKTSETDEMLIRSFLFSWLGGNQSHLSQAAVFAVPLPKSIRMLEQVGFLERTVGYVAGGIGLVGSIAVSLVLVDLSWDLIGCLDLPHAETIFAGSLAMEAAGFLFIPQSIFDNIDKSFGEPGEPVKRSKFDASTTFDLIRLCQLHAAATSLDLPKETLNRLLYGLERQLFLLFLANSRQIEGLALGGRSEASAVVAAHAAIALGLNTLGSKDSVLESWEQGIKNLEDPARAEEAQKTIDSIRSVLENDIDQVERQISRALASASTTEAIDLAAAPVGAAFQLMGMIAGTMAKVAPEGHFRSVIETANKGLDYAQDATSATPDVVASAIDTGISAEAWVRKTVSRFW